MNNNDTDIVNIFENGQWYHSMIYKNIKSKGTFDYTKIIKDLNFPDMKNKSVLDVGCSDGFFSKYFLEELNAEYVKGVDINKYDGSVNFEVLNTYKKEYSDKYNKHDDFYNLKESYEKLGLKNSNKFLLTKNIFDLNMEFEYGSIYDLSNFEMYDVTFCGSLLEHLRDPITAIEQLYFKTKEYCIIDVSNSFKNIMPLISKPYLKYTGAGGNFFHYSDKSIELMLKNVGFKSVERLKRYKIKIEKYDYKIQHSIFIGIK
ncbi:class I SAM-dependent methyltransferase [Acidimicrobiaceae bacterium]|nr:class I SAM-dependent methyltransferase [Acidimicrobiaceae bacterium]|tara:strand:+ start:960 stop:1736 length:777 start_codon:yes stop_codon:yes gene_type:complete